MHYFNGQRLSSATAGVSIAAGDMCFEGLSVAWELKAVSCGALFSTMGVFAGCAAIHP
jgi:hypothetical protein